MKVRSTSSRSAPLARPRASSASSAAISPVSCATISLPQRAWGIARAAQ
jgi:hypothetical protein